MTTIIPPSASPEFAEAVSKFGSSLEEVSKAASKVASEVLSQSASEIVSESSSKFTESASNIASDSSFKDVFSELKSSSDVISSAISESGNATIKDTVDNFTSGIKTDFFVAPSLENTPNKYNPESSVPEDMNSGTEGTVIGSPENNPPEEWNSEHFVPEDTNADSEEWNSEPFVPEDTNTGSEEWNSEPFVPEDTNTGSEEWNSEPFVPEDTNTDSEEWNSEPFVPEDTNTDSEEWNSEPFVPEDTNAGYETIIIAPTDDTPSTGGTITGGFVVGGGSTVNNPSSGGTITGGFVVGGGSTANNPSSGGTTNSPTPSGPAVFKVTEDFRVDIQELDTAGNNVNSALVSVETVSTMKTADKYYQQHEAIKKLLDTYAKLINQEAADLSQMAEEVFILDENLSGVFVASGTVFSESASGGVKL